MEALWVTANPQFRQWALCSSVLVLKLLAMAFLTAINRMSKKVFANAEDADMMKTKVKKDETVERIRRAHLNDLENIPAFWITSLIFVLTEPAAFTAKVCFYGFTGARILHTLFYLTSYQPHRAIAFGVAQIINIFMAVKCIMFFL